MPWHLAILGAGSSAAYFLNTLDLNQYSKVVVIGEDDPWNGQRGLNPSKPNDPANFVNQTPQMISHFGNKVPPMGTDLYPRRAWAASNKWIFDKCNVAQVKGKILKVSQTRAPDRYKAAMKGAEKVFSIEVRRATGTIEYLAAKVIVATGAGPHKAPDSRLEKLAQQHPSLFMDMDAFGRKPELRQQNVRVIVHGPNAAVDTADTAAWNKCVVYWLANNPQLLSTPHQVGARAVVASKDGSKLYSLQRPKDTTKPILDPKEIRVEGKKIKVILQDGTNLEADYYVWGIGQDDKKAVSFIDPSLLTNLEPIYDVNQRHGAAHESVHGFQLKGTTATEGFQVVGALARQVLINSNKTLNHNYLEKLEAVIADLQNQLLAWIELADNGYNVLLEPIEEMLDRSASLERLISSLNFVRQRAANLTPTWSQIVQALVAMIINWAIAKAYFGKHDKEVKDDDLNQALKILTPSTVGSPQLGSIRTTTAAMNGFMPKYVSAPKAGDVNFSHDDQTVLRLYIAKNFPCVPEEDAARLIRRVIAGRAKTKDGWGYTDVEVRKFKDELERINLRWIGVVSTPKMVGTGQTVL